jgi:hypothetical protein
MLAFDQDRRHSSQGLYRRDSGLRCGCRPFHVYVVEAVPIPGDSCLLPDMCFWLTRHCVECLTTTGGLDEPGPEAVCKAPGTERLCEHRRPGFPSDLVGLGSALSNADTPDAHVVGTVHAAGASSKAASQAS